MKIIKTVRGKIIAASVIGVLLLGTTYAFANTNIGEQLRAWYNGLLNEKSEEIRANLEEEIDSRIPQAVADYNAIASEATAEIESSRDEVITRALSSIDQAKAIHMENLDQTKEDILGQVELDLYQVYVEGFHQIQSIADQGLAQAEAGLTAHTSVVGEDALNHVTQELTAAKVQAVQELEDAIEQAKAEIRETVDHYTNIVNNNLVKELNFKYEEVFAAIEEIKDNLVAEQEAILAAAAAELEAEALAAMDEVIANLGND